MRFARQLRAAAIFVPEIGEVLIGEAVDVIRETSCSNVWVAPFNPSFTKFAAEDDAVLRHAIEGMERSFDCIVIDCRPKLDELARSGIRAIEAGDTGSFVLVPVRMETVFKPATAMELMEGTTLFIEEVVSEFETAPACPYAIVGTQSPRKGPAAIVCPEGAPENVVLDMIDFLGIPEPTPRKVGTGLLESNPSVRKGSPALPE